MLQYLLQLRQHPVRLVIVAVLVSYLSGMAGTAMAGDANYLWHDFSTAPSEQSYSRLAAMLHECSRHKACIDSQEYLGADKNIYDVIPLIERGDEFAIKIGYKIMSLQHNGGGIVDDICRGLGRAATVAPSVLLRATTESGVSDSIFANLLVQTSEKSIDDVPMQRRELEQRIISLENATNPDTLALRNDALGIIREELVRQARLPDNAGGLCNGTPCAQRGDDKVLSQHN
jgi:hypothetical protein